MVERTATNLTGEVVSYTAARSRLMDDDQASCLAHCISDLSQGKRVDGTQVDQLDGRSGVRRTEVLREELNKARRRVAEKLNCVH
jgi:hypothetical protein